MGASQSVWDEVFKTALHDAVNTQKDVMKKAVLGELNARDKEEIAHFAMRRQGELQEKNLKVYQKIWKKYRTEDEVITKKEIRILCLDSLMASREWTPRMIEHMSKESVKMVAQYFGQEQAQMMQEVMANTVPVIKRVVLEELQKLVESSDELSEKLWNRMDLDGDGQITEDEFMKMYSQASSETMNPMRLLEQAGASSMSATVATEDQKDAGRKNR